METIREWYAWLYWKAIRVAGVAFGGSYGKPDQVTSEVHA
jgi:hypothetical protein